MSVWTTLNPLTVTLLPWALALLIALAIIWFLCSRYGKPKDTRPRFTLTVASDLLEILKTCHDNEEQSIVIFTPLESVTRSTWAEQKAQHYGITIEWRLL